MGAPTKKGLDYFSLDVGFFGNRKIKRLKSRFGTDGICLYLYILTQIYAAGYYIVVENEEDFYDDIKDTLSIEESKARQIIKYCSDRSMIVKLPVTPEEIGSPKAQNVPVQGVNVLTAAGIQVRYAQAMKKRKKSLEQVRGDYWLLSEKEEAELDAFYKSQPFSDNSENNGSNSENNPDNSEIYDTNKIKLKENIEVSKKVSNKKENNQSYDEIFEEMEVEKRLRAALIDFIRHLRTSYGIVMINSRLESLISKLDLKYASDEQAKCKEVRRAIVNGYKRLECEEIE